MRKYAQLPTHIFTNDLIRDHGHECLLVAAYLHGSQHSNMIGLYYLPPPYIANDTCLDKDVAMAHLLYLADIGFCEYDQKSNYVWLRQQMISEIGETMKPGDNRVKGIQKLLEALPENEMTQRFKNEFTIQYHLIEKPPCKPPAKPVTVAATGSVTAITPLHPSMNKTRQPIPSDFYPSHETIEYAKARRLRDPTQQVLIDDFINTNQSSNWQSVNWQAEFRKYLCKLKQKPSGDRNGKKSAAQIHADGNAIAFD